MGDVYYYYYMQNTDSNLADRSLADKAAPGLSPRPPRIAPPPHLKSQGSISPDQVTMEARDEIKSAQIT
eukprot:616077-Prorocentrum_minimum.AAC.4